MKYLPMILVLMFALSIVIAQEAPQSCKEIEVEINGLEDSIHAYSNLTVYSIYARLGDKYLQLAECYQDSSLPASAYYAMAGNYYERAGQSYVADMQKKYDYFISSGDAYAKAGEKNDALRAFQSAKDVLNVNPNINVNPAYVNQRIYEIQYPLVERAPSGGKENIKLVGWGIGGLVILAVVLTFYYILKRY